MQFKTLLSIILTICCCTLQINVTYANDSEDIIFKDIRHKSWDHAIKLTKAIKNRILLKIILSQKLLDTKYKSNSFSEYINFIQQNPHWPQIKEIKSKAELFLRSSDDKNLIVKWFNTHEPVSANGYKVYALAASETDTSHAKLSNIIKNGWIYGNFTQDEEKHYLTKFNKFLNKEDHLQKIDELLWSGNIIKAKRLMHLVDQTYKNSCLAHIALQDKSSNAEMLFNKIQDKYKTQGLLFRYLVSKKQATPTNKIAHYFQQIGKNKRHSSELAKLQLYYAREFLERKDFKNAYKVISQDIATKDEDIRDVQWFAGWIALRFLHKTDIALSHFVRFAKVAKTPISMSRGAYWIARTYATKEQNDLAHDHYTQAAKHSHTFYGQLALLELEQNKIILPAKPLIKDANRLALESNDVAQATKLLIKHNMTALANVYAKATTEYLQNRSEALLIADIINIRANPHHMVDFAKTASMHHLLIKDYAFPTPYIIKHQAIEAALTYAIIKQESVFDSRAVSAANAYGLMQLIETTACKTAKSLRMRCNKSKLTSDVNYNITLGNEHIKQLINEFNGSYILSIAAYNAGSNRIVKWIDKFGDPRKMRNVHKIVDWIESIPYAETRNYVQRVLENVQVYRTIVTPSNKLRLKHDLLR